MVFYFVIIKQSFIFGWISSKLMNLIREVVVLIRKFIYTSLIVFLAQTNEIFEVRVKLLKKYRRQLLEDC